LGVTINASGLNISGVATAGIVSATTLYGDGTNLTGIALSIAPLNYNPALNSQASHITKALGIGLTFNQGVKAGSGNVTLSLANAGVAGTVVENFSVGSSVSYPTGDSILITPTADLSVGQNYHLSYPSGAFTNIGGDVSYVGTAYTFQARNYSRSLFGWGYNLYGELGQNSSLPSNQGLSSPTQIAGTGWSPMGSWMLASYSYYTTTALKTDGTLWGWGSNEYGQLAGGLAHDAHRSSPVQIPGTWVKSFGANQSCFATKTDGTLWAWGYNNSGQLGQNSETEYSSPVQIPGTTWPTNGGDTDQTIACSQNNGFAIKTDGTLWVWGDNETGELGVNSRTQYSSPVQVPGTTWKSISGGQKTMSGIKTDGTLWMWGHNRQGGLGLNQASDNVYYSSPVQVPGTTWAACKCTTLNAFATKTDGTLWTWGRNERGELGQNNITYYSSPVQIPGTTWPTTGNKMGLASNACMGAIKTDGTLWSWGYNGSRGLLGQNAGNTKRSSPVQVTSATNWQGFTMNTGRWAIGVQQT